MSYQYEYSKLGSAMVERLFEESPAAEVWIVAFTMLRGSSATLTVDAFLCRIRFLLSVQSEFSITSASNIRALSSPRDIPLFPLLIASTSFSNGATTQLVAAGT